MKLHGNAALSWHGRRRLAVRVVSEGWTVRAAAAAAGVSERCARKWVGRYRLEGVSGLYDRSSAPRRVANRTARERVEVVVALRRLRFSAAEIADTIGMALSTVSAVLAREGMGRARPDRARAARPLRAAASRRARACRRQAAWPDRGRCRQACLRERTPPAAHSTSDRPGRSAPLPGRLRVRPRLVDVECPRFRGQLSAGLSGPAERLSGHAKEAEVPKAVSAGVPAGGGGALRSDRSHAR